MGTPLPNGLYNDGTVVVDVEPLEEQLRSLHKCIAKVITFSPFSFVSNINILAIFRTQSQLTNLLNRTIFGVF